MSRPDRSSSPAALPPGKPAIGLDRPPAARTLPVPSRRGRAVLPLRSLLPACLLFALPVGDALAGTLYRCVGKQGEVAFTSSRAGYSQCSVMRSYEESPPAAAPAAAAAERGGASPRVEFRTAPGDGTPTAVAGADQAKVTSGAVFRYRKDGVTHYTNRRPAGQAAEIVFSYVENCFACTASPGVDFGNVALNTTAYAAEVAAAAAEFGIDAALVRAIIHAESAFRPNALSKKGAQGLMQLMPATAERFGVTDAFAVEQNIRGGTRYLAWLLKRFDGDVRLAAAGYNAGEGAVDRFSGVPPYSETRHYVERVGILHERYRTALATLAAVGPAAGPAGAAGKAAGAP
jgi:soluble lytic murein transglycosylase-like protein